MVLMGGWKIRSRGEAVDATLRKCDTETARVDFEEVALFFERHGFTTLALLAAEGIIVDMQRVLAEIVESDPELCQAAFDLLLPTAGDPSILGMAMHLLYVGRNASSPGRS